MNVIDRRVHKNERCGVYIKNESAPIVVSGVPGGVEAAIDAAFAADFWRREHVVGDLVDPGFGDEFGSEDFHGVDRDWGGALDGGGRIRSE